MLVLVIMLNALCFFPPNSELCNKPMDVMFLLDGSPNIGVSEFEEMKNFVQAFIESADISMCLSFNSKKTITFKFF